MSPKVLKLFNRRLEIAMDNIDARCRLHEEGKVAAIAAAASAAAKADEVANGEAASKAIATKVAATQDDLHAEFAGISSGHDVVHLNEDSGDSVESQATKYDCGIAH